MCREGAWVELTVEVTSVERSTTQTARIFLFHRTRKNPVLQDSQTVDKAPANAGLFYSIPSFFDIIKISGKAVFLYDDEKCR